MQNHQVDPNDIVISASQISDPTAEPRSLTINELASMISPLLAGQSVSEPNLDQAAIEFGVVEQELLNAFGQETRRPMGRLQTEVLRTLGQDRPRPSGQEVEDPSPRNVTQRGTWVVLYNTEPTIEHRFSRDAVWALDPCSIEEHVRFPWNEGSSAHCIYSIPGLFIAFCEGALTETGMEWLLKHSSLWGVPDFRQRVTWFAQALSFVVQNAEVRSAVGGYNAEVIKVWCDTIVHRINQRDDWGAIANHLEYDFPCRIIQECVSRYPGFATVFEHKFCQVANTYIPASNVRVSGPYSVSFSPGPAQGVVHPPQPQNRPSYSLGMIDEHSFRIDAVRALRPCAIEPHTKIIPHANEQFSLVGLLRALRDGDLTPEGYKWLVGKRSLWHPNRDLARRYANRFVRAVQFVMIKRILVDPVQLRDTRGSILRWCANVNQAVADNSGDTRFFDWMGHVPADHLKELAEDIITAYRGASRTITLP